MNKALQSEFLMNLFKDAVEEGSAGVQPPLLPFGRRGKRGQSTLFIEVP